VGHPDQDHGCGLLEAAPVTEQRPELYSGLFLNIISTILLMQEHTIYIVTAKYSGFLFRDNRNITWRPTYDEANEVVRILNRQKNTLSYLYTVNDQEKLLTLTEELLDKHIIDIAKGNPKVLNNIKYSVEPLGDNFEEIKEIEDVEVSFDEILKSKTSEDLNIKEDLPMIGNITLPSGTIIGGGAVCNCIVCRRYKLPDIR
jgi:hypothetical protein